MPDQRPRPDEVPATVAAWLDDRADEAGLDRDAFRRGFAAALATSDGPLAESARVAALEDEVEADVDDVRDRVVQLKRAVEESAAADHDHQDLRERLAAAEETTAALDGEVEALRDRLDDAEGRVERGFDNYETVLDHLTESVEDLEDKTATLASVLLDVRDELERQSGDAAVATLCRRANRLGVRRADCGSCGERVEVALLRDPHCPHCSAGLTDVEPKSGLFGSATLVTGDDVPALAGDTEDPVFDEDGDVALIASESGGASGGSSGE
jgi:predicted Zn-ribbon and HTH transcriptional regulator